MADYNVNMKQWNGTSFDNVLPLAYNAKQLEGQNLAEVKQWVQDNGLLLYTGQYTGTGVYGKNNPTSVTFPFKPIIFIVPKSFPKNMIYTFGGTVSIIFCDQLGTNYDSFHVGASSSTASLYIKQNGNTLSWYSSAANVQGNSEYTYYFAAIGGHDMGGGN